VESVELDGLRVAYERAGSGPPLVLLHGYVGDANTVWRHQLDDLSRDFTVVAWDAPGAGGSSDPPETFGMSGYAGCLAGFLAALGLERPHVVGLSFGGALALALLDRHPGVPRSLTLVSAYAGWAGSLSPHIANARVEQARMLSELSADEFVHTLLPTMFSAAVPKETTAAFERSMRTFHPIGFRAMARAAAEDLRHVLPRVNVPTLLVYGDRDVRAPLPVAHAMHAAIEGSRLVVLDGAGHVCPVEAPERVGAELRRFLADVT
jgi:pimeloyl-ACP methyl ester carboxylesterase